MPQSRAKPVLHISTFQPQNDHASYSHVLKSLDPDCLSAYLLLQLWTPGGFIVRECGNVDSAPDGHLPYIVDRGMTVSTWDSITHHLSNHKLGSDRNLNPLQAAQSVAWAAFIHSKLGDLVAHGLYGNASNYFTFTGPHLAAQLPLPSCYYVPGRMRAAWESRLSKVGMWETEAEDVERKGKRRFAGGRESRSERSRNSHGSSHDKDGEDGEGKFEEGRKKVKKAFGREKILEKAHQTFATISRLLEDSSSPSPYIFGLQPTSTDVLLAAHVLILIHAPVPHNGSYISKLLKQDYSRLVRHAEDVVALLEKQAPAVEENEEREFFSLSALMPSWA